MTQKPIRYSLHIELRLKLRRIPVNLPLQIYKTSKERYFDKGTDLLIAVRKMKFRNKKREMALVYKEDETEIMLITIHPLKPLQKASRIKSGRWQKLT